MDIPDNLEEIVALIDKLEKVHAKQHELLHELARTIAVKQLCPNAWDGTGPTRTWWVYKGSFEQYADRFIIQTADGKQHQFKVNEVPTILHRELTKGAQRNVRRPR